MLDANPKNVFSDPPPEQGARSRATGAERARAQGLDAGGRRTLVDLRSGERGVVAAILGGGSLRRRLAALGLVKGVGVEVDRSAPLGDPRAYRLMGYLLSLRNSDAARIVVEAAPPDGSERHS